MKMKKILAMFLAIVMMVVMLPVTVGAATMTTSTFNSKLSTFKSSYFGNGSEYDDRSSGTYGIECFGYANYLANYIFGSFPCKDMSGVGVRSGWEITHGSSAVNSLHVGDIVRYRSHSIFITKIDGTNIYYTDANSDLANTVKWNQQITKNNLSSLVGEYLTSGESSIDGKLYRGWVAHYTNWQDIHTLTVKYNANGGMIDSTEFHANSDGVIYTTATNKAKTNSYTQGENYADGFRNYERFGLSRSGYSFVGWGTAADGGTIIDQDAAFVPENLFPELKNADMSITLYAIWEKLPVLTAKYHANGGVINSTNYYIGSDGMVYDNLSGEHKINSFIQGNNYPDGFVNCTTLGLSKSGYNFVGWGTTVLGGTVYDQNAPFVPENLLPELKNGDKTITLYAIWEVISVIDYDPKQFIIDEENLILVEYIGSDTEVIIPEGVTAIGAQAFAFNNDITSVVIPEGVTVIEKGAFTFCENLETVSLPLTLESIGDGAFAFCYALTDIELPESVTKLGNGAFGWCTSLGETFISDSIATIGDDVFEGCESLTLRFYETAPMAAYAEASDVNFRLILCGDVDDNGAVSAADATLLSRKLSGGDITIKYGGDYNRDGNVNASDITLLRRMLAGANV